MRILGGTVVAAVVALGVGVGHAKEPVGPRGKPAAPAPNAREVVVRGSKSLASALAQCVGRAKAPSSGALVVVDVTAGTKAAQAEIAEALASLSATANGPTAWQVAALGGKPSSVVADPAALAAPLAAALAGTPTAARDTLGLLRKTLKGSSATLVVYLAHAHFEDDVDLEGFVADALRAKRTLTVIGPEAAFERPWNDVVADASQWRGDDRTPPGQGNRPWGPEDPAAPWHGGDTAAPLLPWQYYDTWELDFEVRSAAEAAFHRAVAERRHAPARPPDPAQDPAGFDRWVRLYVTPPDRVADPDAHRAWLDALGPPPAPSADDETFNAWWARLMTSAPGIERGLPDPRALLERALRSSHGPLPSAFPPYGLARATGATGGCYVLRGWGTSDAAPTRYDYARCGLFPPDLRARSEIYADYEKRPLSRALLAAWTILSTEDPALVARTPPVVRGAPAAIEYGSLALAPIAFASPADRDADVATTQRSIAQLARARKALAAEVAKVGEPKDDVDRRLRADAELLLHGLRSMEFQSSELVACARSVPLSAWKQLKPGQKVHVHRKFLVVPEDDDLPVDRTDAVPYAPQAADELVAARVAFLERYRGTPFGAAVARNGISTYVPDVLDMRGGPIDLPRPGRGSSTAPTPPATPPGGGSSGAPPPTTGK
ncbi:MAG: hypothetical protein U1E39_05200 [Planctomycetota bacterium]